VGFDPLSEHMKRIIFTLAIFFASSSVALAADFDVPVALQPTPLHFVQNAGLNYTVNDPNGGMGTEYVYDMSAPSAPVFQIPLHGQNTTGPFDYSVAPVGKPLIMVVFYAFAGTPDCAAVSYSDAITGGCGIGVNEYTTQSFYSTGSELTLDAPTPPPSGGMDSTFVVEQTGNMASVVSSALTGSLPYILGILACLIALGMGLIFVSQWIGSSGVSPVSEHRNSFGVTDSEQAKIEADVRSRLS